MNKKEAKERIDKLRIEIDYHRHLYHVEDKQDISDSAHDSLKHELHTLEQEFPEFITPDSPTQRVGGEPLPFFQKVNHLRRMMSMEDVFSKEELEAWLARDKKMYPRGVYAFYSEIKMDGLAVSLNYKKGLLDIAATRGDGRVGENVTQNIKTIQAIPLKLKNPTKREADSIGIENYEDLLNAINKGDIEVRGEAFMPKAVFDKLNKEQNKKGQAEFANPRNIAAGSIRQLDSKVTAERELSFFGYDIYPHFGIKTHESLHKLIRFLDIPINPDDKLCNNIDDVVLHYNTISKKRGKMKYWTDGIAVMINDIETFERLGIVGKAPRGVIAYKFPAEQATTRIEDIRWQIGRTGVLTPVAIMNPVVVAGTTVQHATLHNIDEIERLGVRIGDTVIIEKAGDIIPKVVQVLENMRSGKEKIIIAPLSCPACGQSTERKKNEVAIVCSNKDCPAKHKEKIIHFVSRKAFNIDGLGDKIVRQLMDVGLISTPADIFKLEKSDLIDLERFAEKSADNLIISIQNTKEISLSRFIYALGIKHVGEETAIDLANQFGTLDNIRKQTFEKLNSVENIGEVVARSIYEYFNDSQNKKLVDDLIDVVKIGEEKIEKKNQKLKGVIFVLTGGLEKLTRDEAKAKIRELGGDVSGSVSRKTDYVVVGEDPGSKAEKAKKRGVKILDEEKFLKIVEK